MNSGASRGTCGGARKGARDVSDGLAPSGGLLESQGSPFSATVSATLSDPAPLMTYARISLEDARQLIDDDEALVVDIRDEASFAAARIEHARHLDDGTLTAFLDEADRAVPLIVCCYHGHSSQQAAAWLVAQGIAEVYSLDGGFTGWAVRFPDDVEGDDA